MKYLENLPNFWAFFLLVWDVVEHCWLLGESIQETSKVRLIQTSANSDTSYLRFFKGESHRRGYEWNLSMAFKHAQVDDYTSEHLE